MLNFNAQNKLTKQFTQNVRFRLQFGKCFTMWKYIYYNK